MSFRFEKLTVWQDARVLIGHIYTVTKGFPVDERFGITNQLRRAATSIALNIAEGSDRKSDPDFQRFLRMALSSCEEVVTGLYISMDQDYIQKKEFDKLYAESNILVAKINALIKSLK